MKTRWLTMRDIGSEFYRRAEVAVVEEYGMWFIHLPPREHAYSFSVSHTEIGARAGLFEHLAPARGCAKELAGVCPQFYSIQDPGWTRTRDECAEIVRKWKAVDKGIDEHA